jgi:hypothetical protein
MKRLIALAVLAALLTMLAPVPAAAGGAAVSVALGLASFAVFNQIVGGLVAPWAYGAPYYSTYYYPPVVYAAAPPPATYYTPAASYGPTYAAVPAPAAPAPPPRSEVVYPHGKYVLRGNGVTSAYQWVWIPNLLPPPPPPPTPNPR